MPRPFERHFPGHEAVHCSRLGWEKLVNGTLLSAAEEAGFTVLVTVDHSIRFQQNMSGRGIAILYLKVKKNDMPTLLSMADLVLQRLDNLQAGTIATLEHPDYYRSSDP